MEPYRGFADLIRRRRKEKEYTLDQVASEVSWSIPYLSELERGIKQPPVSETDLKRLAGVLDLNYEAVRREAVLSRKSLQIELDKVGISQRKLAVMLARRIESGMTDEEAGKLLSQLNSQDSGDVDE